MGDRVPVAHNSLTAMHTRYTQHVFLIGLTGGIAAGKSTIAQRLLEHGAIVLNADVIAREAVAPGTDALQQIVDYFGSDILQPDGSLDREALGSVVFADAGKLAILNGITHPAVSEYTRLRLQEIDMQNPSAIVVYDVPLLIEARVEHGWDLVVIAMADASIRRDRLMTHRGMASDEADRRIAAQATDDERRARADVIIETGGSLSETIRQTDALWDDVQRMAQLKEGR